MTRKFTGNIQWFEGHFSKVDTAYIERSQIERAILTDNIFKIEFKNNGESLGGMVSLKSHNGIDFGGSVRYENEKTYIGNITMTFANSSKEPCMIGIWREDTYEYTCIINLEPVEIFEDQHA